MVEAKRIKNIGNRSASLLENGLIRVVVDDQGGMVPEVALRRENGYLNTHWNPPFRSNSGQPFDAGAHQEFWAGSLLYDIAGNFPCLPSFGQPGKAHGAEFDAHGTTAHGLWKHQQSGTLDGRACYAISTLAGSEMPQLAYRKYDLLLAGHPVHYTVLKVRNSGDRALWINAAWHNTIGPPFLETGCLIDLSADRFATAPAPSEFDDTGRLIQGGEFDDLRKAPLRNGKSLDLRLVPGMVGYTDFITGAVPSEAQIGWSAVVNPHLRAVYLCLFKGPKRVSDHDIALFFNDLWMQYGGRRFTPWAFSAGGTDQTFCLGTENSIGAFANGLEYSLVHPSLLGRPTTAEIPANGERVLYYGTLAACYEGDILDSGVSRVEGEADKLSLVGYGAGRGYSFPADPDFSSIERLLGELPE